MQIKDSGTRRQFDSGAVRDMQEGKGRPDLINIPTRPEYMSEGAREAYADTMKAIRKLEGAENEATD